MIAALLVTALCAVVLLCGIIVLWRELRYRDRLIKQVEMRAAQERQQLLDRIMYLTGKAWTPPPSEPLPEIEDEPLDSPYDPLGSALIHV